MSSSRDHGTQRTDDDQSKDPLAETVSSNSDAVAERVESAPDDALSAKNGETTPATTTTTTTVQGTTKLRGLHEHDLHEPEEPMAPILEDLHEANMPPGATRQQDSIMNSAEVNPTLATGIDFLGMMTALSQLQANSVAPQSSFGFEQQNQLLQLALQGVMVNQQRDLAQQVAASVGFLVASTAVPNTTVSPGEMPVEENTVVAEHAEATEDSSQSQKIQPSAPLPADEVSIIPCRARGMPKAHNFKTAYFKITGKTEHGEGLLCSFEECRNSGIKFRYCTECKDAVAKRNFRNGHHHTDIRNPELWKAELELQKKRDETQLYTDSRPAIGSPRAITAKDMTVATKPTKVKTSQNPSGAESTLRNPADAIIGDIHAINFPPIEPPENSIWRQPSAQNADELEYIEPSPERWQAWGELLRRRPHSRDTEAMALWIHEVLAISDPMHGRLSAPDAPS